MITWQEFLEARTTGQAPARIGVLGLAFDANSSFRRGAAQAPPLIRAAFQSEAANTWSENGTDLSAKDIFADLGDYRFKASVMQDTVAHLAGDVLEQGLHLLSLGGDHSLTYPLVQAISKQYPDLTLVHIDAHGDLYDNFDNNPHSHASPFARIMEAGLVGHLLQLGIRTLNGHQREQVARFQVEVIEMRHWQHDDVLKRIANIDSPVYLSLDIDGLDPAFAPGVSHREAGGLTTRQVLDVIHALRVPIIAADIVEFNPQEDLPKLDSNGLTAMLTGKLFKEVAAQMLANGLPS
ncbi:MAG: agmatinase [Deinococcota bacterium]